MEKTLARGIYRKMEIGRDYRTSELFDLIEDDYYKYISVEQQKIAVNRIISCEMWKIVNAGYAETRMEEEELPIVRGLRFGNKPKAWKIYNIRYWTRVK